MKRSHLLGILSAFLFTFTGVTNVHAAPVSGQGTWETTLEGRLETAPGSGVFLAYYDTVLDITWAANANINGIDTWDNQVAWAAGLTLGGVSGWRLPTFSPIDGSGFDPDFSNNASTDLGYAHTTTDGTDGGWRDISNTPVSELGHMFYVTLGNLGFCTPDDADPISCVEQDGYGLTNTGPFSDVRSDWYWSGEYDSDDAWYLLFRDGYQSNFFKSFASYAWAVRDGDVPTVVDTDGDSVPDSSDNCTLEQNTDQRDTDSDGYGNICDPDFDNNLIVGAADLAYFKSKFFTADPDADLNGDGSVNAADLALLKLLFFQPPGPSYIDLPSFTALTPVLTRARAEHTATLLNDGKVLITGGFSAATLPAPALNTAELYDPDANTFTALTSRMQSARTSHAATRLTDGRVFLTGGQTNSDGDGTNTAELFDPATQTFTFVTAVMTSPRGGHASVLLGDGRVLLMGGFNNSCASLNTAEVFDPSTQSFAALTPKMAASRDELAATLLANGMVLLTGGGSCDDIFDTAELFDPTIQSFTAISATMTTLREGHGSSRLTNGSVLVSGGVTGESNPFVVLDTAELFDPSTLTFSAISERMTATRYGHTQTTLSSGSVLLTGGLNINSSGSLVILDSAETFTP